MKHYSQVFKPTEVLMMLPAFSNIETVHIAAYSHLLDTIGMPELEYSAFLQYKEMKDKFDYMQTFSVGNNREIAKTLAAFGAFTEGLQLFASFAILLNFPRFGKMKGMGQIVIWSVRDETLHCDSIIQLFHTFIAENPGIWDRDLQWEITDICIRAGAGGRTDSRGREAIHPLHRRSPSHAARTQGGLPDRAEPAAVDR
jgi:ribonucleoside-diphosphate reductase beta chain